MVETQEIMVLVRLPRKHVDLAMLLNRELKLGFKDIRQICKAAVREYAAALVRRRLSTYPQGEYEKLCRIAERSGSPVDQYLLDVYSLPDEVKKQYLGLKK